MRNIERALKLFYKSTPIFTMAKNTKDVFKEFYPKLLEILPVDCLITQLYSKKLLSSADKGKLDTLPTFKERAKHFLDEVIEPGLKIDYMDQFDEMLAVMMKSDNPAVTFLASEINESRKIVPPSRIIHGQARSQNSETQSKDYCIYVYKSRYI